LLGAYTSTLLLTLTNPMTILAFAAIYAGLGVGVMAEGYTAAATLVLGVFLGSALWWVLLSGGANLFRAKFSSLSLLSVNRNSGVMITGFGIFALVGLLGF
jgi:arginine exporter protein ArgO